MLSGAESQRLRLHFSTTQMIPARDLDEFGWAVMHGDLAKLKEMFSQAVARHREHADNHEAARAAAAQWIYKMRWGPTRVPIFNLILMSTILNGDRRAQHLAIARWLINEVKVPIDGLDLSGSTALHHAISTKPSFDPEYAQILYDAGGDVNHRNRYGGTPAHEITMVWDMKNREVVAKSGAALKWYLEHGGNIDIKDTDGQTARRAVDISRGHAAKGIRLDTWKVVDDEDRRRKQLGSTICTFCGRGPRKLPGGAEVRLLVCSKCKAARYCSSGSSCQKADWPRHKAACKKAAA